MFNIVQFTLKMYVKSAYNLMCPNVLGQFDVIIFLTINVNLMPVYNFYFLFFTIDWLMWIKIRFYILECLPQSNPKTLQKPPVSNSQVMIYWYPDMNLNAQRFSLGSGLNSRSSLLWLWALCQYCLMKAENATALWFSIQAWQQ